MSVEYPWQSIRIRTCNHSDKEIAICILSVSVRIMDIRKISIFAPDPTSLIHLTSK